MTYCTNNVETVFGAGHASFILRFYLHIHAVNFTMYDISTTK